MVKFINVGVKLTICGRVRAASERLTPVNHLQKQVEQDRQAGADAG